MRLIDGDALIAECENAICPTASGRMVLRSVIRTIKKTPTAYDPDKVVEQLKEEKEFSYADFDEYVNEVCPCLDAEYDDLFNKGLERAIEIVKGEYATEQSCEWNLEDTESNLYVTGCENRQLIFEGTPEENGYKYCPYCGRKINRGGVNGN